MIQKNKFKLSRNLRAQTTPYPNIRNLFVKGAFFLLVVLIIGIYAFARNANAPEANLAQDENKEILGDKQNALIFQTYTVKDGDTLFNISTRYSLDWERVATLNELKEPYTLKIGQDIKLPQ